MHGGLDVQETVRRQTYKSLMEEKSTLFLSSGSSVMCFQDRHTQAHLDRVWMSTIPSTCSEGLVSC